MKTTDPKPPTSITTVLLLIVFFFSLADFSEAKRKEKFKTHEIVPEKELLITDPAVVDSRYAIYPGPLSFGHLMEELAGDQDISDFVRAWLETWENDQTINRHVVSSRERFTELVVDPWKAKDGFADKPTKEWEINIANAPFRLLAVVNRIDIGAAVQVSDRNTTFGATTTPEYYGTGGSLTGEFRLVFGGIDTEGEPLEGGFTVIFEYGLPAVVTAATTPIATTSVLPGMPVPSQAQQTLAGRLELAAYAARWHELGAFEEFDQDYLQHLARLAGECTDRIDGLELADQAPPPLAQLRTNEGAFGDVQEAREFDYTENYLVPAPVAATPDLSFTEDPELRRALTKFINDNDDAIMNSTHSVPPNIRDPRERKKRIAFVAGSALMPRLLNTDQPSSFYWDAEKIRRPDALRIFSLNTCNGCHCGETKTEFYHIEPRREGEASQLSAFLSMDAGALKITPPNGRMNPVTYNEMAQRVVVFEALLDPYLSERDIRRLLRHRNRASH